VDISDSLGYGYQMNSGAIVFVFNDESEFVSWGGAEIRAKGNRKGQ
jgi:hypothetical protein